VSKPELTHGGLNLTAGDVVYAVVGRTAKQVVLRKADRTTYVVTAGSCDCPWWRFVGSRRGAFCKHQRFCFALGLLADPDEALALSMGGVAEQNGGAYDRVRAEKSENPRPGGDKKSPGEAGAAPVGSRRAGGR
jgi:hypothetical protein